jgi:hypothetical protein
MNTPELFYREIPLTHGQVAKVDAADFEWLSQWKWNAYYDHHSKGFYADRSVYNRSTKKNNHLRMHRLILGLEHGDRRKGDHADRDTLNNQRYNLRVATNTQNLANAKRSDSNTSGFKGVTYESSRKKWKAKIQFQGRGINLGRYSTSEEAHKAYEAGAIQYFGEFARME